MILISLNFRYDSLVFWIYILEVWSHLRNALHWLVLVQHWYISEFGMILNQKSMFFKNFLLTIFWKKEKYPLKHEFFLRVGLETSENRLTGGWERAVQTFTAPIRITFPSLLCFLFTWDCCAKGGSIVPTVIRPRDFKLSDLSFAHVFLDFRRNITRNLMCNSWRTSNNSDVVTSFQGSAVKKRTRKGQATTAISQQIGNTGEYPNI